jgi:hypothetical protein
MTGLVRKAVLLAAVAVFSVTASYAGVPSPANSTVPDCVMLLPGADDGYSNVFTASYQPFTVTVRDVTNTPIDNIAVIIDVQDANDIKLADSQEALSTVDCVTNTVRRTTAGGGIATFRVRGSGKNSVTGTAGGFDLVKVIAGSTLLKNITGTTPDENGAGDAGTVVNGLDPGDASFFLYDQFNLSVTAGRSDFNCNGIVDGFDASARLDYQFNDAVTSGAPQFTTYCPN